VAWRRIALGRKTTMETTIESRRGLLVASSDVWTGSILGRPAAAAAEFKFKPGVNALETHPLTIRLPEASQGDLRLARVQVFDDPVGITSAARHQSMTFTHSIFRI